MSHHQILVTSQTVPILSLSQLAGRPEDNITGTTHCRPVTVQINSDHQGVIPEANPVETLPNNLAWDQH